jgi:hypothetical protein
MVRRPGDTTPDPPGGRAAERLRMYEEARGVTDVAQGSRKKKPANAKQDAPANKGVPSDEKQKRRGK